MRRKMLIANWKMNGDHQRIQEFAHAWTYLQASCDVALAPAMPYLAPAVAAGIPCVLAQNVSTQPSGAYTGEVSASMLVDVGCCGALVGHSERRSLYHESIDDTHEKILRLLEKKLIAVLCVGETAVQHQAQGGRDAVAEQLDAVLRLPEWKAHSIVLAYEPVWAIGSGQAAAPEKVAAMHAYIRELIAKKYAKLADSVRILYGGSVNEENVQSFLRHDEIDGFLVGGASLSWSSFANIMKVIV